MDWAAYGLENDIGFGGELLQVCNAVEGPKNGLEPQLFEGLGLFGGAKEDGDLVVRPFGVLNEIGEGAAADETWPKGDERLTARERSLANGKATHVPVAPMKRMVGMSHSECGLGDGRDGPCVVNCILWHPMTFISRWNWTVLTKREDSHEHLCDRRVIRGDSSVDAGIPAST